MDNLSDMVMRHFHPTRNPDSPTGPKTAVADAALLDDINAAPDPFDGGCAHDCNDSQGARIVSDSHRMGIRHAIDTLTRAGMMDAAALLRGTYTDSFYA